MAFPTPVAAAAGCAGVRWRRALTWRRRRRLGRGGRRRGPRGSWRAASTRGRRRRGRRCAAAAGFRGRVSGGRVGVGLGGTDERRRRPAPLCWGGARGGRARWDWAARARSSAHTCPGASADVSWMRSGSLRVNPCRKEIGSTETPMNELAFTVARMKSSCTATLICVVAVTAVARGSVARAAARHGSRPSTRSDSLTSAPERRVIFEPPGTPRLSNTQRDWPH